MRPAKPRPEVIELLAKEALNSMDGMGIDDMTPAEVLSAVFTMCRRVVSVILAEEANLDQNINQITDAIAELYSLIPPQKIH